MMRRFLLPVIVIAGAALGIGWTYHCNSVAGPSGANRDSASSGRPKSEVRRIFGEGRVAAYPGGDVVVSAELEGRLTKMLVYEKDHVRAGQLLAELVSDDYAAILAESKAHLEEETDEVNYLALDCERVEKLWQLKSTSKELLDRARRDLAMAAARRSSWAATVQKDAAILAKTRIVAPIDGIVVSRDADAGEMVRREGTICRIVDLAHVRVEAEIDEFDALKVPVGAAVRISAAGNPGIDWPGTVEEVPDSISQRKLKPQDPAKPTDANILLAKIRFRGPTPLKLGQRVELEVQLPTRDAAVPSVTAKN